MVTGTGIVARSVLRIQAGAVLNSDANGRAFLPTMTLGVTNLLHEAVHSDVKNVDLFQVVTRHGCDGRVDTSSGYVAVREFDQSIGRALRVVQRHFVNLVVFVLEVDAEFPLIILHCVHGGPDEVGGQKVRHIRGL